MFSPCFSLCCSNHESLASYFCINLLQFSIWERAGSILSWRVWLNLLKTLQLQSPCCKGQDFILLRGIRNVPLSLNFTLYYPCVSWWTPRFMLYLGPCEWCFIDHGDAPWLWSLSFPSFAGYRLPHVVWWLQSASIFSFLKEPQSCSSYSHTRLVQAPCLPVLTGVCS